MSIDETDFDDLVGRRIRSLRVEQGMSQKELASRAGLSRVSVSNIEVGRHSLRVSRLYRFAKALSCEASELLPDVSIPDLGTDRLVGSSLGDDDGLGMLQRTRGVNEVGEASNE